MKQFNKYILEAINRGIRLALDDYEDDINLPSSKSNIIKNIDTKELQDFYNSFVDLGLPSGTLWAKCNLGAKIPEEYGDFYQWGETTPRNDACGRTIYKYYHEQSVTKYNSKDNFTELLPEDDAAYQYDHRMKMPTVDQFKELLKYTKQEWIRCKPINVNSRDYSSGILFTGKNGNEMFIPAAGYVHEHHSGMGIECNVWSSTRLKDSSISAIYLFASQDYLGELTEHNRFGGFNIRPVYNR